MTHPRYIGVVKWFNSERGYGFATSLQSTEELGDTNTNTTINTRQSTVQKGQDFFVHHSRLKTDCDVYKTLHKGEYIEFEVTEDDKGQSCADDVTGILGNPLMCVSAPRRTHPRDSHVSTAPLDS